MTGPTARQEWADAVWESGDLDPTDKLILLGYAKYAGRGVDDVYVTGPELRRITGLSKSTIHDHMRHVTDRGWLVNPRREVRKATRYDLRIPPYESGSRTHKVREPDSMSPGAGHQPLTEPLRNHEQSFTPDLRSSEESFTVNLRSTARDGSAEHEDDPHTSPSPQPSSVADAYGSGLGTAERRNPGPFTVDQRTVLVQDIQAVAAAVRDRQQLRKSDSDTSLMSAAQEAEWEATDTLTARIEEYFPPSSTGDKYLLTDLLADGKWTIPAKCVDRYEAGTQLNILINSAGVGHLRPPADDA